MEMAILKRQVDEDWLDFLENLGSIIGKKFEEGNAKCIEERINHYNDLLTFVCESLATLLFNIQQEFKDKKNGDNFQNDFLEDLPELLKRMIEFTEHVYENEKYREIANKILKDFQ
jgi:hypothetical protein